MKTLKAGTRLICVDDTYFGRDWCPAVNAIVILDADCLNSPVALPRIRMHDGQVYDGAYLYRYRILENQWEIKYK